MKPKPKRYTRKPKNPPLTPQQIEQQINALSNLYAVNKTKNKEEK